MTRRAPRVAVGVVLVAVMVVATAANVAVIAAAVRGGRHHPWTVSALAAAAFAGWLIGRYHPRRRLLDWLVDEVGARPVPVSAIVRPIALALAVCVLYPAAFTGLRPELARWWKARRDLLACDCGHGPRPHDTDPTGNWFCLHRDPDGAVCLCLAYRPLWKRQREPIPASDLVGSGS